MKAITCFSRQATARLQPRGLRRRSQISQQEGSTKARVQHVELLQKGIHAERAGGLANVQGLKQRFGTFHVDQLQQLSEKCSGRTARTFLQLSREGEAYAAWDADRRAKHIEHLQSALGAMDWEEKMMPSKAANGVTAGPHTPSIAPHLRVKLSSAEDAKAHTNRHMLAALIEGSQSGTAHHLEDQEQLYMSSTPQHSLQPVQQHDGDAQGNCEAAEVPLFGPQHLQNGHTPRQRLEHAEAKAADSAESAGSFTEKAREKSGDETVGSRDTRGMTTLQGSPVRGIVFDTETTGFPGQKHYILEIAAEDLQSSERWSTLIKIPERVKVTNSYVHGITQAMVSDENLPTMREAGQQLLDFIDRQCSSENAVPLLIAHNGRAFDIPFLHLELQRNGLALPETALFFDTYRYAKEVMPLVKQELASYSQDSLRQHFGIPQSAQAHRAGQDVKVLVDIVKSLLQLEVHSSLDEAVETSLNRDATYAQHHSAALRKRTGPTRAELLVQKARKAAEEGIIEDEDPLLAVESQRRPVAIPQRSFEHTLQRSLPASSRGSTSSADTVSALMQQRFDEHPKGFTDKQCKDLIAAGFDTIGDLLLFFPRDHNSYGSQLQHDAFVHMHGTVHHCAVRMAGRLLILEMEAMVAAPSPAEGGDYGEESELASSTINLLNGSTGLKLEDGSQVKVKGKKVISMFGGWGVKKKLEQTFAPGAPVIVRGRALSKDGHWELDTAGAEFLELGSKKAEPIDGLEPVYPQKSPLKAKSIPKLVAKALGTLDALPGSADMEILPQHICAERSLMPWCQAVRSRHLPKSTQEAEEARQRLAFEELLVLQLRLLLQRTSIQASQPEGEGVCMSDLALLEAAREGLGFQLTGGQEQALDNVLRDLEGPAPMMCLLQGDVGCGKTAVAFLATMAAAGSGYQAAMMLPTEILAAQTQAKLRALIQRMPEDMQPRAAILTGSTRAKERREITAGVADGSIDIVVGTHALISESVQFNSLGLAIVDEQHRFGVEQRARLAAKATPSPHVMYMTATPIPRTLALCEHGDLALYTIDELPPGRQPITTKVVKDTPKERAQVYEAIQAELADGGRAYIICPLVGESSAKGFADTKAAEEEHRRLTDGGVMGADVRYGLLHGRLSAEEKSTALEAFATGDTNVLIATTVVEVGVDVPEASVIMVEGADRFGLAALHQLRGRVGRGTRPSACYLVSSEASERLAILEHSHNGFRIAEADLIHRGPGDFLGKKQSGRDAFSSLKSARLPQDRQLLEDARRSAAMLCAQWREGEAEPPAPLLAAVHRQAKALLDINQLTLPVAVVESLEAL